VVEQLSEKRELQPTPDWEVPIIISYNSRYERDDMSKSIMKPFYMSKPSEPEKMFIEMLDASKNVKWWFKNGETETKYFAVLYTDGGFERAFYVDFVVQFEDGSIGLFDTKSGMTAKDAKARAEGLRKYIKEQTKKGKKLWGGIVTPVNGSWKYNDNEVYTYDESDLGDWKFLNI
jgi:type III restriction enzyme